jgi:hypothetical protein
VYECIRNNPGAPKKKRLVTLCASAPRDRP